MGGPPQPARTNRTPKKTTRPKLLGMESSTDWEAVRIGDRPAFAQPLGFKPESNAAGPPGPDGHCHWMLVSPPFHVARARYTLRLMLSEMKWTAPSAKANCTPPPCRLRNE